MKEQRTILIADDEASMRSNLSELLTEEGYALLEATDGVAAVEQARSCHPDVVLLDINLPRLDGLAALKEIRKAVPEAVVIVFTAYGTSERAIQAMKAGAYDYIEKPFDLDEFLLIVRRSLQYRDLIGEVKHLRSQIAERRQPGGDDSIIGSGGRMQEIFKLIGRVAPTDATVLIQGESGTGKELIADAIQRHSLRASKPFVRVNCGALPETLLETEMFGHEKGSFTGATSQHKGRFELADGGTTFLDEVNNMPPSLQMKLLRVLQQQSFERVGGKETLRVDVRVIAATNKDLESEMKEGRFREDLFYRLNVIHIKVPPLRDHPEDISVLAEHFLRKYSPSKPFVLSNEVMRKFRLYSWPGNIRELENVIQRSLVLARSDVITLENLPLSLRAEGELIASSTLWQQGMPLRKILADVEKEIILKALQETGGNRTRAAAILHIHRRQLFSKIKQYSIRDSGRDHR
jgi:DNA-binding NtrC family response regulator